MDDYEVIATIGKGSFGQVKKIQRKSDGKILVWKELNYGKMSEREKTQLVSEVNIIRELKHPHVVRYYDRIIDKKSTKIFIIMEYCEGGDLSQLLKKCKKDKDFIAEDVIWKIMTQIFLALHECHNRKNGKILHRDLKPANIFLDNQNNIKLGDFGLARIMGENSVFAQTHVGTPYYMSPEQINESNYDEKSDIWSTGCLLYELAALKPPFQAQNHLSLAIKIKSGQFDRLPIRYSEDLQNLIKSMINIDANKRPSVEQLLAMPQIDLRLQERKLRERHALVKKKESELKEREEIMKKQQELLEQKEKELEKLEQEMNRNPEENKENQNPNILQPQISDRKTPDYYHPPYYSRSKDKKKNLGTSNSNNLTNNSSQSQNNSQLIPPPRRLSCEKNEIQTLKSDKQSKILKDTTNMQNQRKSHSLVRKSNSSRSNSSQQLKKTATGVSQEKKNLSFKDQ